MELRTRHDRNAVATGAEPQWDSSTDKDKARNETKIRKVLLSIKNTWHVESNYLLQPPKYLTIVNRFRYINKTDVPYSGI